MNTQIALGISQLLKISLAPLTPLQARIDPPSPVHGWIFERALQTLRQDGQSDTAFFFSSFQTELNQGLLWADKGWKNFSHYCQAEHKFWPRAAPEAEDFFLLGSCSPYYSRHDGTTPCRWGAQRRSSRI